MDFISCETDEVSVTVLGIHARRVKCQIHKASTSLYRNIVSNEGIQKKIKVSGASTASYID